MNLKIKNMAATKDNSLMISAPRQGIAQSPHIGFGDVRNLDIYSVPGIAKLNNILVKKTGTTVDAQVWWMVQNPANTAEFFALDANGVVYTSTDSGATWSEVSDRGGAGQGLAIWNGYLFVAETTTIDVYGPLASSPTWTDNWKTIDSDTLWHPMFVSKNDGKLYGGAGRYVFSLEELTTFDPSSAPTYTFTQQALDLPENYRIKCIEELGNNLMLGTWQGSNVYDLRVADIFPWDRSSASFGQPIVMAEFGVHAMRNTGNSLVVLAGINGTIFRCDGVNAYPIGQLPQDLSGGKYLEFYPGAIENYKNKVFFGVGQGGSTAIPGMGVYSLYQTSKGNILNLEHLVSTLSDGSTNPLKPTALLPVTRDILLVGWRDNATYGIDLTTATSYAYTTNYSGYFESPLYMVGTLFNSMAYTELEFQLAKKLAAGEGIQVKYRTDLTESFTTVGTYTFNLLGAITAHKIKTSGIRPCQMIQIRVELLGTNITTPQFKSLTLR
jgi:hypothetical protein